MIKVFISTSISEVAKRATICALLSNNESSSQIKKQINDISGTLYGPEYEKHPLKWEDIDEDNQIVFKSSVKCVLDNHDVQIIAHNFYGPKPYRVRLEIARVMKYIINLYPEEQIIFNLEKTEYNLTKKDIKTISKMSNIDNETTFLTVCRTEETRMLQVAEVIGRIVDAMTNDYDMIVDSNMVIQSIAAWFFFVPKSRYKFKLLSNK